MIMFWASFFLRPNRQTIVSKLRPVQALFKNKYLVDPFNDPRTARLQHIHVKLQHTLIIFDHSQNNKKFTKGLNATYSFGCENKRKKEATIIKMKKRVKLDVPSFQTHTRNQSKKFEWVKAFKKGTSHVKTLISPIFFFFFFPFLSNTTNKELKLTNKKLYQDAFH